jgi:hypothetical protein
MSATGKKAHAVRSRPVLAVRPSELASSHPLIDVAVMVHIRSRQVTAPLLVEFLRRNLVESLVTRQSAPLGSPIVRAVPQGVSTPRNAAAGHRLIVACGEPGTHVLRGVSEPRLGKAYFPPEPVS